MCKTVSEDKNMIKNIGNRNGEYTLEQVNCIEDTIRVALETYGEICGIIYLMYIKLQYCYNLSDYVSKKKYSLIGIIEKVLDRELGIKIYRKDTDNFYATIENLINEQNPVLILGNLRELFYSEHYMESDWTHLFYIKGYDSIKRLFYIMDSAQFRSNGIQNYYEFVIPYQVMHDMYKSCIKLEGDNGILYIKSDDLQKKTNEIELMKKFLEKYLNGREDQPYVEITLIEEILEKKSPLQRCEKIMRLFHSKEVLYNEIGKLLTKCNIDEVLYEKYVAQKNDFIKEHRKISNKIIYLLYKNKKDDIKEKKIELKMQEKKIRQILEEIYFSLQIIKDESTEKKLADFENNQDEIISILEGKYKFSFCGNRVFNYWQRDESPKVILYKSQALNEEFSLQVRLCLKKYEEYDKFYVGLFVRTTKETFYLWGINCGVSLRLENTGINPNMYEEFVCEDNINLQFRFYEGEYFFGYSFGRENYNEKSIFLEGSPKEAGIMCKTWDKSNELLFEFSNIKLLTNVTGE